MIMLTSDQVPRFWEAIKYAAVNADYVEEEFRYGYLNRLLYLLLSGKSQCFVRLSSERKLQMILITKIVVDEIRDEKTLFISCLYSFEKVQDEVWRNDLLSLREFAKVSKCKTITTWVVNDKAANICKIVGMKDRSRSFILDLNGGA